MLVPMREIDLIVDDIHYIFLVGSSFTKDVIEDTFSIIRGYYTLESIEHPKIEDPSLYRDIVEGYIDYVEQTFLSLGLDPTQAVCYDVREGHAILLY